MALDMQQKSAELSARLDRLPFSKWHRNLFVLCFLGVMFDACDFALFGMALPPVAREFGLNPAQAGLLAIWGRGESAQAGVPPCYCLKNSLQTLSLKISKRGESACLGIAAQSTDLASRFR